MLHGTLKSEIFNKSENSIEEKAIKNVILKSKILKIT